jgi:hypothetical protein
MEASLRYERLLASGCDLKNVDKKKGGPLLWRNK